MNITLANIDLNNTEHLAHAVRLLNNYAGLSPLLISAVRDICIDFRDVDLVRISDVNAPVPSEAAMGQYPLRYEAALAIYGKTTRAFLRKMLERIHAHGSTTLEDAAADANISLDTARAYLRNAGRTASALKVTLPVRPEWQPDMGCNTYTAAV